MKTSVSFLGIFNWDIVVLVFALLYNLFGGFVFRTFIHWNMPKLNITGTVKWKQVSTNKGERMFWLIYHLYILYIFVLCSVRRFFCSEASKVKVPLLSALVLLPGWRNICCICLLELHIRTNRESYLWISVGIYQLKVSDRNTRTICEVLLLILYR